MDDTLAIRKSLKICVKSAHDKGAEVPQPLAYILLFHHRRIRLCSASSTFRYSKWSLPNVDTLNQMARRHVFNLCHELASLLDFRQLQESSSDASNRANGLVISCWTRHKYGTSLALKLLSLDICERA